MLAKQRMISRTCAWRRRSRRTTGQGLPPGPDPGGHDGPDPRGGEVRPAPGLKFSTYATWWIRQAVARRCPRARTIRLPVHVVERLQKVRRAQRSLMRDWAASRTRRRSQPVEAADRAGARSCARPRGPVSLDAPIGEPASRPCPRCSPRTRPSTRSTRSTPRPARHALRRARRASQARAARARPALRPGRR